MDDLFPMSPNPTQILFMQVSPPWVLVTSILVLKGENGVSMIDRVHKYTMGPFAL
jgi:hypothetical protein